MNKVFKFPKGFLWGAATSAHQVEGGNRNDWTEWEKANAERLVKEAKNYWQKWQQEKFPEMFNLENYISGRTCDNYDRYEEDFNIAKSLGHNAHRFSIEWSRIEPEEGKFNEKEIEHYRKIIHALRARGMEPFVTLWHWTNPIWIRDIGGWENKKTIEYFLRYVGKIADSYQDINFWIPLNEPGSYVGMGYIQGAFPPQVKNLFRANKVFKNLMEAHKEAYSTLHKYKTNALVGISHYAVYMLPYKNFFWNRILVKILDYIKNWRFLNTIGNKYDFIGIQYYHTDIVNLKIGKGRWWFVDLKNTNNWTSDLNWWVYPEGIYHILRRAARYKKPIYITENGVADARDIHRKKFIKEHLRWIYKAIQENVSIRGYFHWSLLDNFEWDKGFWPRFGLVEVNYKTFERKLRSSAHVYAEIARSNSVLIIERTENL